MTRVFLVDDHAMVRAGVRARRLGNLAIHVQNVNAWHGEGLSGGAWSLDRLLLELAEAPLSAPARRS